MAIDDLSGLESLAFRQRTGRLIAVHDALDEVGGEPTDVYVGIFVDLA